ncbi:type II toxin-antitoxin system VapC family toxin [Phreatobacter oligotrophus]|jgi:predicted nucleic acid-binding protein|uniref:type II toxin-antitoxin system VapC family toxin n=1 Tax=Phreatobacter oligotrophus TaxID=1122261 RepID=UPI0023548A4A|nr:type II toxin-antitoxin system VapC family toxin [Phreatobacter oligotrophus]MBX9992266.1 type II toxin-antitoxin system VapC family toxin [Phreatobacter oligotrophus]
MTALLVVDASVVVKWYTDEPDSPSARSILISGTDLIAPDVIVAEVLNALWSKRRKGLMPHLDLDELERSLLGSFTEIAPSSVVMKSAFTIALDLDHPVYDCLYLALAAARDCRLVTADARLLARLVKSPHRDRVMPLRDWPG